MDSSPATPPGSHDNEVAAAQASLFSKPEKKFLPEKPRPIDLETKSRCDADNAAVREQLRKHGGAAEDTSGIGHRLERRLDGSTVAEVSSPAQPPDPAEATESLVLSPPKKGTSLSRYAHPC